MRMTVELLAYANRQKVAEALTDRGYSVTRMTVNRWARGGEMPGIAARMILELFRHTETPLPQVEERLESIEAKVDSVLARQDTILERQLVVADSASQKVIEALADPVRLEWEERIAEGVRAEFAKQSVEASDDPPGTGAQGGAGQGALKRE